MASFNFELVSPERLLFSGSVEAVVVPGAEGEFTVLRDHAPVMTTLKPGIVEVDTYRYRGHSMSDPATYRTKDELERYKGQDPIIQLKAALVLEQKLTAEQFDAMDEEAKRLANESVKFADESPEPPLEALRDYTFVK